MRNLSVIIVNYQAGQLIADCIHSVYLYNGEEMEIIVVDNASGDDSKEIILGRFPQVQWIQMDENTGFARGNNAGIRAATGELLLLLNPDTIALDDSIRQCATRLSHSSYAAAGIQLVDETMKRQISGSFFVKGGLNHVLPIPYWGDFVRWVGYQAGTKIPGIHEAREIEEVDWISGAFLMVRRSAIAKAGLMDEDFFLYGEEVEWCSRLGATGKLVLFGDLKIIHLEGTTINKSQNLQEKGYYNLYDNKGLQLMVSNHLRVRKQYGVAWFIFLLLNYSFGFLIFSLFALLLPLVSSKKNTGDLEKAAAFGKNVGRLWQLAPAILRNKPYFYKML